MRHKIRTVPVRRPGIGALGDMGADGEKGRVLTGPLDRALNVVELGLESMTRDVGARAQIAAASAPSARNRSPEKMTAGQARLHQRLSWIRAKKNSTKP